MDEKHQWLREYLTLVDWMRLRWGGKVKRQLADRYSGSLPKMNIGGMLAGVSSTLDDDTEIENILTLEFYPALETAVEGHRLWMALSDSNMLALSIEYDIPYIFRVRHEHWGDRMFKKLRLDYEFQTGDAAFDEEYYIVANDPSHRAVFLDATFREMLRKMEPFAELATTRTYLGIVRPIDNADLLHTSSVENLVNSMLRMAHFLKR